MDIKDAMQQATVKLRDNLGQGSSVLAPNASQPIQIDPVLESFFGLQGADAEMAGQVKDIQDYLASNNLTLDHLKNIELRLGEGQPGTRLEKLYRYVRLKTQADSMNKQAEAMEK